MAGQHAALAHALGARGADEVLAHDGHRLGPDEAGETGDVEQGQGQHRQDEIVQPVPEAALADGLQPAGRKPAEPDREDEDQNEREPEGRRGAAGEAEQVDGVIVQRVGPGRRPDAERYRDGGGEQEADAHEQQGAREMRAHDLQHRPAVAAGKSQVAAQRRAQPVPVALADRQVEAVEGAQPRGVGRRQLRVGGDHDVDRIARHQPDQGVDQEGHDRDDRQRLHQPADQECAHCCFASAPAFQSSTHRVVENWCPVGRMPFSQRGNT